MRCALPHLRPRYKQRRADIHDGPSTAVHVAYDYGRRTGTGVQARMNAETLVDDAKI